ncbi:MAG: OmpA family protein [Bacteroidales bacterium]|nr:OmpA family protein [Bacteroidales bacterium]
MRKFLVLFFVLYSVLSFGQNVVNQTKSDSNKVKWEAALLKEQELAKEDSIRYNVQWASKVIDFSSQYSKTEKSAKMVLGRPNVLPRGGDASTAWAVKAKNGQELAQPAFIKVGFANPMMVQQIAIAESFNAGAISEVIIYGTEKGQEQLVYKGQPSPAKENARMFNIFLPQLTEFYVASILVKIDPIKVAGWNEIDAIGISDGVRDTMEAKINVVPDLKFSSEAERLSSNINSIYDEVAPMISPDGKTVYFDRKKHPENAGGFNDEDDIWYSIYKNNKWSVAKNVGFPLNNKFSNFVQSITPDGNSLLLGNIYNKDGSMNAGVSLTYRTRTGWAFPEEQYIDDFYNLSPYANYFLSNDGRVILLAIQRKDSRGGLDLYVSFLKEENHWSKPKNLGPIINTYVNDYSPFLAADGVTFYYSTSGYPGYGEEDIFMTKRLDDTWENWSEPQNLGPQLNTDKSDTKYNIPASGEYAYYSSMKASIGKNDIFRIKLPQKVKPNPVVLISGRVFNDKTNEPVDARIIVEELPGGNEVAVARTDPNTGEFKIILPAGKKYGFRAIALGFFEVNKSMDLTDIDEYTEIEDEVLRVSPIEVGSVVRLNNIFFEFAKATLKSESFPELDRTVTFLEENKTLELEIAGHTDNVGSDATNQKLSQARAQSVVNYLTSHGVPTSRLIAKGYGESRPVAFNNTEEGRAMNRRVEFKVLKK